MFKIIEILLAWFDRCKSHQQKKQREKERGKERKKDISHSRFSLYSLSLSLEYRRERFSLFLSPCIFLSLPLLFYSPKKEREGKIERQERKKERDLSLSLSFPLSLSLSFFLVLNSKEREKERVRGKKREREIERGVLVLGFNPKNERQFGNEGASFKEKERESWMLGTQEEQKC